MSSGGSHISSAIRGVRSGPPVSGEREELDPLRSELLSLRSASLLVSGCSVSYRFYLKLWQTLMEPCLLRPSDLTVDGTRDYNVCFPSWTAPTGSKGSGLMSLCVCLSDGSNPTAPRSL
ncbi:hypothetical protein NDU88_006851 [Pleurodeles waltl]|uniref:Uncharacterized protein n=1 Tax=Pleurodeles waltl TaxID=8319 RepID=A0AAV7URA3_PLEWA|nr:hypothetical protein NDU88_006851 [Pleurodeles waltl]